MTDQEKRIQAMYFLEATQEVDAHGAEKPREVVDAFIWAAHYLVQSMMGGPEPENFEEVIAEARRFDAMDEANEALARAGRKG